MMKNKSYLTLFFLLSLIAGTGCNFSNNQNRNTAGQTIISEDSLFSVTIPKGWTQVADHSLNDDADLQAQKLFGDQYFVAIIEAKADLDYTFDEWMKKVMNRYLASMDNPSVTEGKDVLIDGQPAKQYEITMTKSRVRLTLLATYVNGKTHFAQILAWTLASKFQSSVDNLDAITHSITGL